ncbi:phosphoribosylaminoimidazole-succinocarboxamide synthase [Bacillus ectoiniformans]|uniref:phosphoribosylaminoimidazolesuccinocarboxamide synthase n=1 Tax=Bacillus ectoiniformans TaxID=1494429 RepID=UPI001956AAE7|nr:phosphoribosylaminoimidazolesuccinocarboxamide synthase [Bacillus ectoiniformans]MBM7650170.1 phosphoribosylaminoimidazole-succinocarboxamide synthase [Bacillus ectoiniformans]
MKKGSMLYEGKAKRIYATGQKEIVWIEYKDSATAFNGEKKAEITGKGRLNNQISSLIFLKLKELGIPSHFIEQLSDHEQLVKHVQIIPIEVVVRNTAAGSLAKRLGLEEGMEFSQPIVEFYLKNDELGDPLLTEDHIQLLSIASTEEVKMMKEQALKINEVLLSKFDDMNIKLIDFKVEFGKDSEGNIMLADEISPDTCRFWEKGTNRKLDKDVFRRDLGNLVDAYTEIFERLGGNSTCTK